MNAPTMQEIIDQWLATQPDGAVIVAGEYSPNGSPSTWQHWVTGEVEFERMEDYHVCIEGGELNFAYTPERSKHIYRSFSFEKAEEWTSYILLAFHGEGSSIDWSDIDTFAAFLRNDMGLDADSDAFAACMQAALREAADRLER